MHRSSPDLHSDGGASASRPVCPRCGGAGILRLDDQRYRTCLDCLGQGRWPHPVAGLREALRINACASPSR